MSTFEPVNIKSKRGPLYIFDKRWYFRLVSKPEDKKRARALMDDYNLNVIEHSLVICYTPETLPGYDTTENRAIRIYAIFESYVEFFLYRKKFEWKQRAFYEIIFGELRQKPHFDIDIDLENFNKSYPGEDIDECADILREAVITSCDLVLKQISPRLALDLETDMLIFASHGKNKRSFHIIINNRCHIGNKEAKAYAEAVIENVKTLTDGKFTEFIDRSVYSPRQQFRIVGCQKTNSGRPKMFCEKFYWDEYLCIHRYSDDVSEPEMKSLTLLYESLISFCPGCVNIPSMIKPVTINFNNLSDLPELGNNEANECFSMLKTTLEKSLREVGITKNYCPFSIKEIQGQFILLNREKPSYCPICQKTHEAEHPYLYVVSGKIYWDCRRSAEYAEGKKLFVGYLGKAISEM